MQIPWLCFCCSHSLLFVYFILFIPMHTVYLLYCTFSRCGPCQMMVPHLEGTASVLGSRVRVGKMDSDKHPQAAGQYKVQGLPTVLLLRGNEVIDRVEGMMTQEQLVPWVERHL
jgi:thioredoxin-like negative regulator of GroEL